jgi:hypothetical protein
MAQNPTKRQRPGKPDTPASGQQTDAAASSPHALTDTELVILAAAAAREDGCVLPLPKTLKANEAATTKTLETLHDRKLITEVAIAADDDTPLWRRNTNGERLTLKITDAGLAAIDGGAAKRAGIGAPQTQCSPPPSSVTADAPRPRKVRPGKVEAKAANNTAADNKARPETKTAIVLRLLKRKTGASLSELTEASGWQAHSVRGFLSGTVKKKLALPLVSEVTKSGTRRYRIDA